MHEAGADSMAFPVIVASGPNGAMAHHTPGDRKLKEGDAIIVDMGAAIGGYNSDLTRSFLLGNEDQPRFREVYDLVLMSQESALKGIKPGITGRSADRLARDVIEDGGFGTEFGHSLGHGIGLEVHENPRLSHTGKTKKLPVGSVVTIEPGIYIRDWGGIRIEDLALITETGNELLSHCPKNPIVPVT
jgi:Xaa-Pro aminopeptidase